MMPPSCPPWGSGGFFQRPERRLLSATGALRAALLVPLTLAAPRPADGFDPCPGCTERACADACPAKAVTAAGWDVPGCAAHRLQAEDPCASRCHARFDCVIGRPYRYPPDALEYHQGRALAGLALRARTRT